MSADKYNPIEALSNRLADLHVALQNFTEEGSADNLLKLLALLQHLRAAMHSFDKFAVAVLRQHGVTWSVIASSLGGSREDVSERYGLAEVDFGTAEQHLAALLAVGASWDHFELIPGNVYTRNNLRTMFGIGDATINTGVFPFWARHEIWLFVTENKPADREQYVDKLVGDVLYWQGQRMGRTDSLIIDHKRTSEKLLLFYRIAKYEFEGAGFRYVGLFEYVRHSGSRPTNFVLRRAVS